MTWFSNNAPAIIAACSAIFAALIASLSTLFGIWLNNKQNLELRQEQAMLERWKSNRELYIIKGEEVFTLFNEWHGIVYNLGLLHIMHILGQKTFKEVQGETAALVNASVISRIQALLNLYFNESIESFDKMKGFHGEMILQYSKFIANKDGVSEAVISLRALLEDFNSEAEGFKLKLSNEVKSYI